MFKQLAQILAPMINWQCIAILTMKQIEIFPPHRRNPNFLNAGAGLRASAAA
jgi:hypothetical protein